MNGLGFYLITDLHYYDKALGIEGKAYDLLCQTDVKALGESGAIIDAYIDKILDDKEIDIVLIAGDLSCNGAMESHLGLIPKLKRLTDGGKRVFAITATHDYYDENDATGRAEKCVGDNVEEATQTDRESLLELYAPFGLNEATAFHKESHSYCVELNEKYRLLCLNDDGDKKFCGYSPDQLDWIREQTEKAKKDGCRIIAMTHHPVLPPTPIYPVFSKENMLGDYETTSRLLADWGIEFIFTGHAHMQNINKITTEKGNVLYDINTSSLVGYPSIMRKVILDDNDVTVTCHTVHDFDWDRKGKTAEEYLKNMLHGFLNDIFVSAGYNIDHLAQDLAVAFSRTPESIYENKKIITLLGKIVNNVKLGTIGRLLFVSDSVDRSIKNIVLKDFIIDIIENLFYGNEPYTPETPQYRFVSAVGDRVLKLLSHSEKKQEVKALIDLIKDGVLYDNDGVADWDVVLKWQK